MSEPLSHAERLVKKWAKNNIELAERLVHPGSETAILCTDINREAAFLVALYPDTVRAFPETLERIISDQATQKGNAINHIFQGKITEAREAQIEVCRHIHRCPEVRHLLSEDIRSHIPVKAFT